MYYLITGSREWDDPEAIRKIIINSPKGTIFIFGDCKTGADRMAYGFCIAYSIPYRKIDAEWDRYGLSAGPRRNREMVEIAKPTWAFAFLKHGAKNKGTIDCIHACDAAGVRVKRIYG